MRLDICLAADDNYAKYMGTTIASILDNSKEDEKIYFHLIDGGITEENKNKILSLKKIKNCEMIFYTPDIEKYKEWFDMGNFGEKFSPAMFYRLDIHKMIPNVDKILYLDSDTIVLKSLKEMFTISFDDKYALVALVGKKDYSFFNSGVIMINSKIWRKSNIEKEFNNTFYKNTEKVLSDEEILNICLKNKVKFISKSYNYIAKKFDECKFKIPYDEINIIHYVMIKPWSEKINGSILLDEFWKYYQLTPWFFERPIDAIQTILYQKYSDYEENKLKINDIKCFGIYHNKNTLQIVIFFIKITIEMNTKNINKIAWWIPIKKYREKFKRTFNI